MNNPEDNAASDLRAARQSERVSRELIDRAVQTCFEHDEQLPQDLIALHIYEFINGEPNRQSEPAAESANEWDAESIKQLAAIEDPRCIRCGIVALDTGWECTECGCDMGAVLSMLARAQSKPATPSTEPATPASEEPAQQRYTAEDFDRAASTQMCGSTFGKLFDQAAETERKLAALESRLAAETARADAAELQVQQEIGFLEVALNVQDELRAECAAEKAQRVAAEKEAELYRWLRDNFSYDDEVGVWSLSWSSPDKLFAASLE